MNIQPVEQHYKDTANAFDSVATNYNGALGNNRLVQHMRACLWRSVHALAPPGSDLLDLGCGTGLDAVYFAQQGYNVTAIDGSAGMVEQTSRVTSVINSTGQVQVLHLGIQELHQLTGVTFDLIYSDMGALNCLPDLAEVATHCASLLRRGGHLVVSVMGRYCPWEMLYYGIHGDRARARLRLGQGQIPVSLNGGMVWTRYYTPTELYAAFSAVFQWRTCRALNLFLPPPYLIGAMNRLPGIYQPLAWLDRSLGALPALRQAGDHFLLEMTLRD